jgi:hypothetical protein
MFAASAECLLNNLLNRTLNRTLKMSKTYFFKCAVETQLSSKKKEKVDIFNNKQVMELFRNSWTPVY